MSVMQIEFENSVEDVLYLNLYHYRYSPLFRNRRLALRFGFPAFLVFVCLLLVFVFSAPVVTAVPVLLVGAIWVYMSPRLLERNVKNQVAKMHSEGKITMTVGRHRLSLNPDALADDSDSGRTRTGWKDVESIVSTERHIFIYTSPTMAYIVPKRVFGDESGCREFIETAKRYCERCSR